MASSRRRFLVALVVDGPSSVELDGFRRALRGPIGRIPPHITVIPPLNIAEDAVERAQVSLVKAGDRFRPFRLTLGPGATFSPVTPVVYLEVSGEIDVLWSIRAELTEGAFAPPDGRKERAFIPHVTLGNHLNVEQVNAATTVLASYRVEVVFDRLVLFQQDEESQGRPWLVFDEAPLAPRAIVGRGGRELVFSTTHRLNSKAKAFFDEAWSNDVWSRHGEHKDTDESFAISCQSDGNVIAAVTGRVIGRLCFVDHVVVDVKERASGVGTALVLQVEQLARQRGCETLRTLCLSGSRAAAFFSGRGFQTVNELRSWSFGENYVVLERGL